MCFVCRTLYAIGPRPPTCSSRICAVCLGILGHLSLFHPIMVGESEIGAFGKYVLGRHLFPATGLTRPKRPPRAKLHAKRAGGVCGSRGCVSPAAGKKYLPKTPIPKTPISDSPTWAITGRRSPAGLASEGRLEKQCRFFKNIKCGFAPAGGRRVCRRRSRHR